MGRTRIWTWAALVCFFCVAGIQAQQDQSAVSGSSSAAGAVAAVPRLIKFSGRVLDARGEPLGSVAVRLTFAVYEEQQGGAALWAETQMVELDEQGHYSVLLGATRSDGLPVELFPAGKARWLGVQVEGRDEDPRVLLVSVPYALKAEDAAMLGGRSASDFVLSEQLKEEVRTQVEAQKPTAATSSVEMLVSNSPIPQALTAATSSFTASNTTQVVKVEQTGTGYGLYALAPSSIALFGQVTGASGTTYGVRGESASTSGVAVLGEEIATSGSTTGVRAVAKSAAGTALVVDNTAGGKLLSARANAVEKFSVDGGGTVTGTAFVGDGSGLTNLPAATPAQLAAEASARASGDTTLQNNINSEAVTRTNADAALQSNINAKVSKAGDTMTGTLNLPANGLAVTGNQLSLANGNVGVGASGLSNAELYVARGGTEDTTNYGLYVSNATAQTAPYLLKYGAYVASSGEVRWDNWGMYVDNQTTNTTTDDAYKYGIRINSNGTYTGGTGTFTRNWGLYVSVAGADLNYPAVFTGGNVGIGTTSPVDMLQVAGDIRVGTGTTGCVKDADATVIAGVCSSDRRLKTNIHPFPQLLDKLVQLTPVQFSWKSAEYPELHLGTSQSFGLIAQEVEKVFPQLVTQDAQGWKAVKYNQLPFLMLQGIRELRAENNNLKEQMKSQQVQMRALEAELTEAKQILRLVQAQLLPGQRVVETAGGSAR